VEAEGGEEAVIGSLVVGVLVTAALLKLVTSVVPAVELEDWSPRSSRRSLPASLTSSPGVLLTAFLVRALGTAAALGYMQLMAMGTR
jgi:hypothetical protein